MELGPILGVFPEMDAVDTLKEEPEWLQKVLNVELLNAVKFLTTSQALSSCSESKDVHGRIVNLGEANLMLKIVSTLAEAGFDEDEIGVITPFRAQVNLLKQALRESDLTRVEVNTVDQYQGRDKSVVIYSCVRTSADVSTRDILNDERRLNVAISRAKNKLILLGNHVSLRIFKPFAALLDILRSDQIVEYKD
ncbi:unnamed protein product [Notodromas monacha]|uniref:DNA replication ATP-dependent helicase/nuclease n=1 Tax=Notodromas monacha TaxID=399045 RepID=A0A7R9GA14_9CRUS|nr:unnamed protein product [Notodromas monacha]CAG0913653.1 unnamed protein product [Notodromas monacha]